jgi:hypothetical protein
LRVAVANGFATDVANVNDPLSAIYIGQVLLQRQTYLATTRLLRHFCLTKTRSKIAHVNGALEIKLNF